MTTQHTTLTFQTMEDEIVRIDQLIQDILSDLPNDGADGCVTAFVPGSTGSLTTIEFEPGLIADFTRTLNDISPKKSAYQHNKMNHDDNGHAHVKAGLIGPSITIPFVNKRLLLGMWQQLVFLEFDTRPRNRTLEIMIIY